MPYKAPTDRQKAGRQRDFKRERRLRGRNDSFYSAARWRRVRRRQLRKYPLCRMCDEQGRAVQATDVDHITPMSSGGEPYEERNLQSLCKSCHSIKTNRERQG